VLRFGEDFVQPFLDLLLEVAVAQVPAGENRPLGAADFEHGLVGRVGDGAPDRDRIASAEAVPDLIAVTYLMNWL
jgi:hypothetical protein